MNQALEKVTEPVKAIQKRNIMNAGVRDSDIPISPRFMKEYRASVGSRGHMGRITYPAISFESSMCSL